MRSRFARSRHRFGSTSRGCGGSRSRCWSGTATTGTAGIATAMTGVAARSMESRFQTIQDARFGAGIATAIVLLEFGKKRTTEQRGAASRLASWSTRRGACRMASVNSCRGTSRRTCGRCCARIVATVRTVTDQGQTSFQFVQDAHASAVVVARRSGGGTASAIGAGHAGRSHEDESGCHSTKPPEGTGDRDRPWQIGDG